MSRLTFARSAGAAGPKMTDVRYNIYIDRLTDRGRVELPRWGSLTLAPIIMAMGAITSGMLIASVREVADGTKNADSAGLNRFPIWPATFARSAAHAQ